MVGDVAPRQRRIGEGNGVTTRSGTMTHLRLASFPHLSYLPQLVAEARGFFADAGLAVALAPHAGPWSTLIEAAGDGAADLVVGNVWFALQRARRPDALVPVAHCLRQTRFFLCRRSAPGGARFSWEQLDGAVVIVPTDVPTPWVAFREALAVHGIPLDRVRAVVGYSGREAAHDLRAGSADLAVLDIERMVTDDLEEAAALAEAIGPVPWSVYLARRADVAARPDVYRAFQHAIDRALDWIGSHDSESSAALVAPLLPEANPGLTARIIERYRRLEAWPASSAIEPEDVERWHGMLVRWGLLREPVDRRSALEFTGPGGGPG